MSDHHNLIRNQTHGLMKDLEHYDNGTGNVSPAFPESLLSLLFFFFSSSERPFFDMIAMI